MTSTQAPTPTGPEHVVVVGASLAGLSTARALRARGFAGRLTVVGDELHRPYDRPPLSKEFLGHLHAQVELSLEAEDENLDAMWRLGERAVGLTPLPGGGARVELSGGDTVEGDGVVLATGASARCTLPGVGLPGVHVLRTLDDAVALRAALHARSDDGGRVVVVGGGFIASEVAATASGLGCRVALVVPDALPLSAALGPLAASVTRLHAEHGVEVVGRARVVGVRPADAADAAGVADAAEGLVVELSTGERVPAATVVLGVGADPTTGWLRGSGVTLDPAAKGAVRCDGTGATDVPGVYAVGDCAVWFHPGLGHHHPVEHWTSAKERGAVVAAALTGADRLPPSRPPYAWSDLYGRRLQLAGYTFLADDLETGGELQDGATLDDASFTAVFRRGGETVAVVSLDQPRVFAGIRRRLADPAPAAAPAVVTDASDAPVATPA
ncbi:NAD(P)/FAD-dependent oxidoreductase [Terracoccus luteus]|uniref:NADPH-dependent 2,4-dienoyl-CoA reductase/sulfur reductase-like enzyme n=1 Tax=Terracoccus luteus TaxID=53356 RepID=A0A839PYW9_9MICO|nr:FAD-dependent oxidoreductase [Terracoccus luteus]MBB2987215.1 NADPH-dependent 2,4-dienoyl-CoA reductase/sulfur reductase-like enzyme [Terracoccus luteus]MCP2172866.1 NADPH-dependent 2,4-dienoyl-CoA reductase/sulfur reductase-like enzyme [Terracoccus luteus]